MSREAKILGSGRRVLVGTAGLDGALQERPAAVVSFGLCGGLDPALGIGELVVGTSVVIEGVTYPGDPALCERLAAIVSAAALGPVAGSTVIAAGPAEKEKLRAATGAIAVDMESHVVAAAATGAGIPFAVLRAVSDRADDALPKSARAGFRPDGQVDVMAVIANLARQPSELPALLRTARHAGKAFAALESAARQLG
jgi:hopanoid-associated phosphorylase